MPCFVDINGGACPFLNRNGVDSERQRGDGAKEEKGGEIDVRM